MSLSEAGLALHSEVEARKEILRRLYRGEGGLLPFCRDVLHYKDVVPETHGILCRMLEDAYWGRSQKLSYMAVHRYLFNLPRKSLKSSIITVGFPIWVWMQNDPPDLEPRSHGWRAPASFNGKPGHDQRFLIGQETDDNCRFYMTAIQDHLRKNETLNDLFGPNLHWSRGQSGLWKGMAFNIPWRQDRMSKEPNANGISLGSSVNSLHNDIALFDDIFSDKQLNDLPAVIEWYRRYMAIADNPSILMLVGTRWDDGDLYGHVQDEEPEKWTIYVERAERTDEQVAAGMARLFFPRKLPQEVLDDMKSTMRPYLYSCQMLNEPIDQDTAMFKASYFEHAYYTLASGKKLQEWLNTCAIYTLGDPAISDDPKACLAVVLSLAVDTAAHVWLLDLFARKNVNPTDYLDEVYRQHKVWSPLMVGVEDGGFQKVLKFNAEEKGRQTGIFLPWVSLKPAKRNKDIRIQSLEPICSQGRLHLLREHQAIEDDLLRFPRGRVKDRIDCLAYLTDIVFVPQDSLLKPEHDEDQPVLESDWFRQKLMARRRRLGLSSAQIPGYTNAGALKHWYSS